MAQRSAIRLPLGHQPRSLSPESHPARGRTGLAAAESPAQLPAQPELAAARRPARPAPHGPAAGLRWCRRHPTAPAGSHWAPPAAPGTFLPPGPGKVPRRRGPAGAAPSRQCPPDRLARPPTLPHSEGRTAWGRQRGRPPPAGHLSPSVPPRPFLAPGAGQAPRPLPRLRAHSPACSQAAAAAAAAWLGRPASGRAGPGGRGRSRSGAGGGGLLVYRRGRAGPGRRARQGREAERSKRDEPQRRWLQHGPGQESQE